MKKFRYICGEAQLMLDDMTVIRADSKGKVRVKFNHADQNLMLFSKPFKRRAFVECYSDKGDLLWSLSTNSLSWIPLEGLL